MTYPEIADRTYIEPLTREYLEEIIRVERELSPSQGFAILPTVGGQTALNLAIELSDGGVLEKYNVQLIGANVAAIKKAEDRLYFKDAMQKIGLDVPKSALVNNLKDGLNSPEDRLSRDCAAFVHSWWQRRRHCVQQGRTFGSAGARA